MSRKLILILIGLGVVAAAAIIAVLNSQPTNLVLTGVITTNDVIVSPQVAGQVEQLLVKEGDTVQFNQLVAILAPAELRADQTFYARSAQALAAQVAASESNLAAVIAQDSEAKANLANAKQTLERNAAVVRAGAISAEALDAARTAYSVAQARANAAAKQVAAARSTLASLRQQQDAAAAQATKADVRLGYTEIRAPIAGTVDVSVARVGEVITAGQPVVTLINPDDLWVRADVEESYIDRVRIGDTLTVRLASGVERPGVVFYRAVDADFATQRDVSRTKRDIKTFEIRLRVDNGDRRLAVGMTAYVLLPLASTAP